MEWAPVDAGEHSGVEESKARLLALGVPDYVLNDLTAEDLAACDGAILVVVDVDDYPVNSGRRVSHSYWIGGERHTNIRYFPPPRPPPPGGRRAAARRRRAG